MNTEKIRDAKEFLKEQGYQTDNLWTIHDVKDKYFNATDEQAHEILTKALTNQETISQIQFAINMIADEMGLESNEE